MPSKRKHRPPRPEITFENACAEVETALSRRREILSALSGDEVSGRAFLRLREALRSHVFPAATDAIRLDRMVQTLDGRARRDGFHVLHDWDGKADKINENTIPVDVLDFFVANGSAGAEAAGALAILLDYYLFYVLALFSLRVWDEGDAGENLDRLGALLRELQGPKGSGHRFVEDAETLILIATSHFEADDTAYDRLLAKVKTLSASHRTRLALAHAAILASHLRFGFEATYARDTAAMRQDNVPDYPWLLIALATLMETYDRMCKEGGVESERERIVEGILNGLTPDAAAFVGAAPEFLSPHRTERARFAELFERYHRDLLEAFDHHRPGERTYSPLSFFFNFSHNLVKGAVVDALLRGAPWRITVNDLLTGSPAGDPAGEPKETLAKTLMSYARASPDRIRGALVPAVIYDPRLGRRVFADIVSRLRG